MDIYGVEQLISEPTRITSRSSTLIDLCLTNTPSNIVKSGVIHLSISDHSLVYLIRKAHIIREGHKTKVDYMEKLKAKDNGNNK